ncbi:MAG: sigma-70 family RNA polymerase sigma factor [Cyanobacteria bacterium J06598_3]
MNPIAKTIAEDTGPAGTERAVDTDLLHQLWAGDTSALGVLYDRYASLVYSIALKGLGSIAEAEDLTQEVFLCLAHGHTYDPQRGALASYLTVLTRSRAIDRLRARTTQKKYLDQWNQLQDSVELAMPMHHVTQQERRILVREALGTLKAHQREVLELSYYEGQSQRDIAQRLGVPLGTVKSWARRGLLQLREQLTEQLKEQLTDHSPRDSKEDKS